MGEASRLPALDSGGVRGLSWLMTLQQQMATVDPESPPKPCEYKYFDMIGGTSTGGLIRDYAGPPADETASTPTLRCPIRSSRRRATESQLKASSRAGSTPPSSSGSLSRSW